MRDAASGSGPGAAFPTLTKAQHRELDKLYTDMDTAVCALYDRLEEIVAEWTDEHSEKSERWQESDAGQDAQSRIDTLQGIVDERPDSLENPANNTDLV